MSAMPLLPWVKATLPIQIEGARRALKQERSYEEALVQLSAHLLVHSEKIQLAALAAGALLLAAEPERPKTIADHARAAVDAFAAILEAEAVEGTDAVALEDARAALDRLLEG